MGAKSHHGLHGVAQANTCADGGALGIAQRVAVLTPVAQPELEPVARAYGGAECVAVHIAKCKPVRVAHDAKREPLARPECKPVAQPVREPDAAERDPDRRPECEPNANLRFVFVRRGREYRSSGKDGRLPGIGMPRLHVGKRITQLRGHVWRHVR